MLGYQVEYTCNGVVMWTRIRAGSAFSARCLVEHDHPGCTVVTVLPWVARGRN
jgi:hypothetical protein